MQQHSAFFMPIPSTQQKPYPHLRQTTPPIPFLLPTPIPAPALSPTYISRPRRHLPRHRFSSRLARLMSPTILLDTHLRRTLSTLIPNTYSQHTSSTRNTHMSSVYISSPYIQTASRTARYALRTTYRHIHKVISVIRPSRKLMGIHTHHTYHTLLTLGADITKKGGEFSFASPIVLS